MSRIDTNDLNLITEQAKTEANPNDVDDIQRIRAKYKNSISIPKKELNLPKVNIPSSERIIIIPEKEVSDSPKQNILSPRKNESSNDSIKSLHSYSRSKSIRRRSKKIEGNIAKLYEITYPHSHLILLLSVILICLFYCVILRINQNYVLKKYSHSLCLGLVCLIDLIINREQFENINETFETQDNLLREGLLKPIDIEEPRILSFKIFLFYTLTMGIFSFLIEFFTFYLLEVTTKEFGLNAGVGFALLSFELIMIRMQYSFNDIKIDFINFLGLLTIFSIFIYISLVYLPIPLAGVAFLICVMRTTRFFLTMQIYTYTQVNFNKIILWINSFDFAIGFILTFVYLLSNEKEEISLFDFTSFFLYFSVTLCYYFNMKYFREFDRYGISILSLTFPIMALFDLLINHRGFDYAQIIIMTILTLSACCSFIGDKLVPNDDQEDIENIEREIQHQSSHILHHKKDKLNKQV